MRALLFILLLLPLTAQADTISIRADVWCPCNCAPDARKQGFAVDVVKKIFEKAGHTVDYQLTNWNRAIERTRAGEFTAILCASHDDAPDFTYPKEAVGVSQTAFLTKTGDDFMYVDTSSLAGRRMGVILGYSYDADVDAYIKMHKDDTSRIDFATGDDALERNITKLIAGRIDLIVDDASVLEYKINALKISDKVEVHRVPATVPVHIGFSPANAKSKDYAELFDKGMKELRDSGDYGAIMKKYGLSDWTK
jgi:polar amino acid transport system substrate-binding protein